jgi:very-short-patch-repair endonuclease
MDFAYSDPHLQRRTVLVAVVNQPEDLRRAASDGWYRIPQRRAPRRIGADYLAFYQTGAFQPQEESHTITWLAPVQRYHLLTRAELLPDEAKHPRAQDYYFRIAIGSLVRLDHPIPAAKYRRVTFIHTTLERLLRAEDITDLRRDDDPFDALWQALRDNRLRPLPNRLIGDWPADIALRARNGYLGIRYGDEADALRDASLPDHWRLLRMAPSQITGDLDGCLRRIGAELIDLGGALDTVAGPAPKLG